MSTNTKDFGELVAALALATDPDELRQRCVMPLVNWLTHRRGTVPLVAGVSGAQGSGKSTLCTLLAHQLEQQGLSVATLSIDDLYLSRARRGELAARAHPLFTTRGVPGTHDVTHGIRLLDAVKDPARRGQIRLPRFDKSTDEPFPERHWSEVTLPVDVLLFEGWCVGATPQAPGDLVEPCNELESQADPAGRWRGYVNEALRTDYRTLFSKLDALIFLRVPAFEHAVRFRQHQEQQLKERLAKADDTSCRPRGTAPRRTMDDAAVRRFTAHFERITRHMLATTPSLADGVIDIDETHAFNAPRWRTEPSDR